MIPVTTFANQTVAVFGLGTSGNATALALMAGGATVAAWDDGAAGRASAEKAGIPLLDLSTADWSRFAALVLAPGVPLTHPEPHWTVKRAQAAGIEVIGDIELFCRERNILNGSLSANDPRYPDAPFIAITGTNGKSTTTALIAHILRQAGMDVQMGGNIGVPILALEPPAVGRYHVIEMSSFQIDLTPSVNPTVGVLLNITPDHLDRHGPANDLMAAMRNYASIKKRLVTAAELAVIGVENGILTTRSECEEIFHELDSTPGKYAYAFSRQSAQADGIIWFDAPLLKRIIVNGAQGSNFVETLADLSRATALRGAHNAENAAAAFWACELLGIPHDDIGAAIKTYPGLPHRMEEIGRVGDVLFINDSKATNADSTEKALLSFPRDVFWIVGGKPKEGGIEPLRPYFPGIVRAYLIGAASNEFARTLDGDVAIIHCGTLDIAVARASADAAAYAAGQPMVAYNVEGSGGAAPSLSSPGTGEEGVIDAKASIATGEGLGPHSTTVGRNTPTPNPSPQGGGESPHVSPPPNGEGPGVRVTQVQPVVLLSPACASYDQFANFEKRGDAFRALVTALPGFVPRSGA